MCFCIQSVVTCYLASGISIVYSWKNESEKGKCSFSIIMKIILTLHFLWQGLGNPWVGWGFPGPHFENHCAKWLWYDWVCDGQGHFMYAEVRWLWGWAHFLWHLPQPWVGGGASKASTLYLPGGLVGSPWREARPKDLLVLAANGRRPRGLPCWWWKAGWPQPLEPGQDHEVKNPDYLCSDTTPGF